MFHENGGRAVKTYEVRSGRRAVAYLTAGSAQEALADYMHALGCRDAEIVRMGSHASAWRGAIYRVAPADSTELSGQPAT